MKYRSYIGLVLVIAFLMVSCSSTPTAEIPDVPATMEPVIPAEATAISGGIVSDVIISPGEMMEVSYANYVMAKIKNESDKMILVQVSWLFHLRPQLAMSEVARITIRPAGTIAVENHGTDLEPEYWYVVPDDVLEISAMLLGLSMDGTQEGMGSLAYSAEQIRAHGLIVAMALQGTNDYSQYVAKLNGYSLQESVYSATMDEISAKGIVEQGLPVMVSP